MRNARKQRTALLAWAMAGLLLSATALPAQDSGDDDKAASPFAIELKSRTFTPSPGVEPELRALDLKSRKGTLGLIQFEEVPDEALVAQLEGLGVKLLQYVPNNTWIAKLPADVDRAASVFNVRWVGRLLPEDKLSESLREKSVVALDQGKPVLTLDVEAAQGSLEEAAARVQALGGTVVERDEALAVLRVTLPRKAVRSLAESDAVIWISPEMPLALFNNFIRTNAQVNTVHLAPYGLTGAGVQLGIWDGGQIYAHADFGTRLTVVETGTISAHATHVAGTMAGSGLRSNLYAPGPGLPAFPVNHFRGVAHGADIIGYNFAGIPYSEHNAAINTYGIDNSQNSWGIDISTANANCATAGNYELLARNYDLIINGTYGRKIPVVFAAGNDRNDGDCSMSGVAPFLNYSIVAPPATAKNVISVGAINADNSTMTDFSNWGPVDDGRLKPDLVTGGSNAGSNPFPAIVSTSTTNGYAGSSGTSMAAPAVSGAIGLLLQRYRAICPATGTDPLPSTLKAVLIHTARDLDDGTSWFNRGPDYASGYGALDVKEAVDMLPFHREDSVGHSGTDTFNIVVTRMTNLKVTLVWDDPAAASGASTALINNLDLELEDPLGNFHRPWILNPGSPAAAATRTTATDNRNVVEQVVVDNVTGALAGTWKIHVRGANVPSGPQSYSLVTQHLPMTSVSCAGASTAADPWVKDKAPTLTPLDPGTEPNPDTTWIAQSNEVWIRYDDLNGIGHLDPEVGQPNYITTRVWNRGTATANTIRVMFYVASSSTGIGWPAGWTLVGEKTIANLAPGASKIVNTRWDPPAIGHYCLYIRLLSDQDPMTFAEGPSVDTNTRNNNNIIWRNVDAYNVFSEGPVVVLFGNTLQAQSATLRLTFNLTPDAKGRTLLDFGKVQIRLSDGLAERMAAAGIDTGASFLGFERVDDRTLILAQPEASFPELPLGPGEEFPIEIEVSPATQIWDQEAYILNIVQSSGADFKPGQEGDPNAGSVHLYVRDARATGDTPIP